MRDTVVRILLLSSTMVFGSLVAMRFTEAKTIGAAPAFEPPKVFAQGACTDGTLRGAYGYGGSGSFTADNKATTVAEVGRMDFDGAGGVKGVYSFVSPVGSERREYAGTYHVAHDCTGSATVKIADVTFTSNFVVADLGGGVLYSEVSPNLVVTGRMSRINP